MHLVLQVARQNGPQLLAHAGRWCTVVANWPLLRYYAAKATRPRHGAVWQMCLHAGHATCALERNTRAHKLEACRDGALKKVKHAFLGILLAGPV